jgi:hypothetical protein
MLMRSTSDMETSGEKYTMHECAHEQTHVVFECRTQEPKKNLPNRNSRPLTIFHPITRPPENFQNRFNRPKTHRPSFTNLLASIHPTNNLNGNQPRRNLAYQGRIGQLIRHVSPPLTPINSTKHIIPSLSHNNNNTVAN